MVRGCGVVRSAVVVVPSAYPDSVPTEFKFPGSVLPEFKLDATKGEEIGVEGGAAGRSGLPPTSRQIELTRK